MEPMVYQRFERIHKMSKMVQEGKTDGKMVQNMEIVTSDYDDHSVVITGHRCFRDQAAAEEFRDWWLQKLELYKIFPEYMIIQDLEQNQLTDKSAQDFVSDVSR
jgi:hypothetical protein